MAFKVSACLYEGHVILDFLGTKYFLWGRFLLGGALAAACSLAIFEAPTRLLWWLAVAVTEWGHWLAVLALVLFLVGGFGLRGQFPLIGLAGAVLCLAASVLALTPLPRALKIAHHLPAQLEKAFGVGVPRVAPDATARPAPLILSQLFTGVTSPAVRQSSVIYSKVGEQELRLDLYQAGNQSDRSGTVPGLLVVHGGGWQSGDSAQLSDLNVYLAARGYVVAAVNYRLAPKWKFPAALEDVRRAIAYLKDHAQEFHLDPQRLALLGRSAGGQLALLTAYTAHDPAIRGAIAFYTPPDLRYSYTFPANPAVLDSRGLLRAYLGGDADNFPTTYLAASPFYAVSPETPPTLLIHGGRDELVSPEQSERLAIRLAMAGRPQYLLVLPWATHGCDANFSGPCGQLSTYAVERFLAAVMK
jgi:acetyl esterase/lipase